MSKIASKILWNKPNQGSERHTLKTIKKYSRKEIEGDSQNRIIFHALGLEGLI